MTAPRSGVKIRMYRLGHGDCFLLAFPGKEGRKRPPVYVLIDCGFKPGSQIHGQKIDAIVADIIEATGGKVDVCIVTHEHQDHVNGFGVTRRRKHIFDGLRIGQLWLAWTENGNDQLANQLRESYHDQLMGLAFAEERLGAVAPDEEKLALISELLELEVGGEEELDPAETAKAADDIRTRFRASMSNGGAMAAAGDKSFAVAGIRNKTAIKYLRDRAEEGVHFLAPDGQIPEVPKNTGVRAFPLGPPRNERLLLDLDPVGAEEFHMRPPFAMDGVSKTFFAAAAAQAGAGKMYGAPFAQRYQYLEDKILGRWSPDVADNDELRSVSRPEDFLRGVYGPKVAERDPTSLSPKDGESWRRIDGDWLDTAESLAIRLNDEVNNTSLVLAFELPDTKKVLLFTGDAQRGSWISWSDLEWNNDGEKVTAKDLLGRCTFYKVGHHGSHNATLNGTPEDDWANIGWLGRGKYAEEFTAMIPANSQWARKKRRPWDHPLPKIEESLQKKAKGRVFRSDIDHVDRDAVPDPTYRMDDAEWEAFQKAADEQKLYLEFTVED